MDDLEPTAADKRFQAFFRRGTQLLHQGKASQAVPLLEKACELDPAHVDAVINLSGAYILTKKFSKAIPLLEEVSQQHPNHAMVWTNLGAAYLGNPVLAGDVEQKRAIAAFENALAANPAAPNVAYNIGLIYRDRREIPQAIDWFKKAIQANPNDQDARNILRRLQESDL